MYSIFATLKDYVTSWSMDAEYESKKSYTHSQVTIGTFEEKSLAVIQLTFLFFILIHMYINSEQVCISHKTW